MKEPVLLQLFIQFGLAGLIGFLLGLEREMSAMKASHIGIRDFVFFALLGAISAFIAGQYGNPWIIIAVFGGVTVLLITQYWASHEEDVGITTEMAAVLTFMLGVLLITEATELAIALAILASGILFQKEVIHSLRERIQKLELQAVLKFLIITFIILPVLPRQTLDTYLAFPVGNISATDRTTSQVEITVNLNTRIKEESEVRLYSRGWEFIGTAIITDAHGDKAYGNYIGDHFDSVDIGAIVRIPLGNDFI
ncbi:MAG: MgtC/SapB family protein, partial [Gammaproteobacteria bacterium]